MNDQPTNVIPMVIESGTRGSAPLIYTRFC